MKTLLVTGGGEGLGFAIAQRFAKDGYRVALADIDSEKAMGRVSELGSFHMALHVDVAEEGSVALMMNTAVRELGRVDVVVHNAGVADSFLPTVEQNGDDFRRVLSIHLVGGYYVARAAGQHFISRGGGGNIINMSSIAGLKGLRRRNAYSAGKAGLIAMTEAMACEWARYGIRVNAICPGYMETRMLSNAVASGKLDKGCQLRRIPMGRFGEPNDVAEAAFFLASDAAQYITGVALPVDGGWQAFSDSGDASYI